MAVRTASLGLYVAAAVAGACVGSGDITPSISGQIVGSDERPLGPGLAMFEIGPVHDGAYQSGSLIDDRGHFTTGLTAGGTWGIHLFHDTYSYLPLEITIDDHEQIILTSVQVQWGQWLEITGEPTWPDQPTDLTLIRMPVDDNPDDNPVIDNITMSYVGSDLLEITLDANDPDADLSRMVLVHDLSTGGGYALNPPSPPDSRGDYPNGTYTLSLFLDDRHVPGQSEFQFVLSDNLCNNSPITSVILPER